MASHDALLACHTVHRFVKLFSLSFVHHIFTNTFLVLISLLTISLRFFIFNFVEDGSVIECSKLHLLVECLESSDVVETKFCHF